MVPDTFDTNGKREPTKAPPPEQASGGGMRLSMHDGVEVWCDCCSCEAEPYWVEAFSQQEENETLE